MQFRLDLWPDLPPGATPQELLSYAVASVRDNNELAWDITTDSGEQIATGVRLPEPETVLNEPAVTELADGELRIFESEPEHGDRGRMYVLDVHGYSLLIYPKPDGVYVHVDDGDSEPRDAGMLTYEIRNGGANDCG